MPTAASPARAANRMASRLIGRYCGVRGAWSRKTTTVAMPCALALATSLASSHLIAQIVAMPPPVEIVYVCPFDASVRSLEEGVCRRRGQRADLVAEVPDPLEFPLRLTTSPARPLPDQPTRLRFEVQDPWQGKPVEDFAIVHEKPFHVFVVSQDLEYFLHAHPRWRRNGFELDVVLPSAGLYRVLTDFLPEAATPQFLTRSLFVAGVSAARPQMENDLSAQQDDNLRVEIELSPQQPVAGSTTTVRFRLEPEAGIEPYLGALGHMLVASADLIELMHMHPVTMRVGADVEFTVVFPRPVAYRAWVQFQRLGVVNTVHFDIAVSATP
jgi:hypothetical protein